jgi:5-formyltetrahydrofolate cyclo-ligase
MTDSPSSKRQLLRRQILNLRNQLRMEERTQLDRRLCRRALELPVVQNKQRFFVYCSYQSEVATGELIDQLLVMGKTVCVPLSDPATATMQAVLLTCPHTELVSGYKGIPEPASVLVPERIHPPEQIEVAFIPGSVFDHQGYRLGYGGGYYDRFLALVAPQVLRIGLAYSFQVVARIPRLAHDVPMDLLVTENEVFSWSRNTGADPGNLLPEKR